MLEKNDFFSKDRVRVAKGILVILMLIHHLFGFPEWLKEVTYISVFKINNVPIEYYIGQFGKICVGGFLFLSGYGMYGKNKKNVISFKDIVIRLSKFIMRVWIIFLIFIPIGFVYGFINNFYLKEFIENICFLKYSYNPNWWFIAPYIGLTLLFPILNKIINKSNFFMNIILIVAIHFLYYLTFLVDNILPQFVLISNLNIYKFMLLTLAYQVNFSIGILCAKYQIFDKLNNKLTLKESQKIFICIGGLALVVFLRKWLMQSFFYKLALSNIVTIDAVLVPLFLYFTLNIVDSFKINNILKVLGDNSNNIWLIHGFFCTLYLQKILYSPKLSILIVGVLVIISLLCSYIINILVCYAIKHIRNIMYKQKMSLLYLKLSKRNLYK